MKSTQGNINLESNSVMKDIRINLIKEYFTKNSLINNDSKDETKERDSLLKTKKNLKQYGHIPAFVIDPFSSGEESDIEEEKLNEATIRDVSSVMIDLNTIMTVRNFEDFPKEARPALLLQNMDEWITTSYVKQYVEDCPIFIKEQVHPKIDEVKILRYKNMIFAFVIFQKLSECEMFYKFMEHPIKKKKAPTKNSKGGLIDVHISYDLLDLTLSHWYGVVLRNLPNNCTHANVKSFCENHVHGVLYALYPIKIKSSYCSIVILKELDDAENLCVAVNNKEIGKNKRIKAHLHPRCCKIRRNPEKSHYLKLFVNNKITFNKIIKESSNLVPTHLPVTKLKIFQTAPAKVESDTTNNNLDAKDHPSISGQSLKNLIRKSPENPNNLLNKEKAYLKKSEKSFDKSLEKDMYTSLLALLSIPSSNGKNQEKSEQTHITSCAGDKESISDIKQLETINYTQPDDTTSNKTLENHQINFTKIPSMNNIDDVSATTNQKLTSNQEIQQVISTTNSSITNKESIAIKTNRKSSNNTIQVMTNIGKMLELINKSQIKPIETTTNLNLQEKNVNKAGLDLEKNKDEPSNILNEVNINNNASKLEEIKLDKNDILMTDRESTLKKNDDNNYDEDMNDIEYITYDFNDLIYYKRPRKTNIHSKFGVDKGENRQDSKYKNFNNTYPRNYNNNFNSSINYPAQKTYYEQTDIQVLERDISTFNNQSQINASIFNNQLDTNNNYFKKNRYNNKNIDRRYTNNNFNKYNTFNNINAKKFYSNNKYPIVTNELSEQINISGSIESYPPIGHIVNIDITESTSTNVETLNRNSIIKSNEQNFTDNNNINNLSDLITIESKVNHGLIPFPKEENLPPLPTTRPPEPEIRIHTSSESVVVVESQEEPGQIVIYSSEDDKNKSDKKIQSSTNSEEIDIRSMKRKRSRSRDRNRDDYYHYKGNYRRHGHLTKEYVDKGNYSRKDSSNYKEHRDNREYNHSRNYRDTSRDNNDRRSYKHKTKNVKFHRSSSKSSSSSKDSSNDNKDGLYMRKLVERSKFNYSTSNSSASRKYPSQKAGENLDSREKHFKYK